MSSVTETKDLENTPVEDKTAAVQEETTVAATAESDEEDEQSDGEADGPGLADLLGDDLEDEDENADQDFTATNEEVEDADVTLPDEDEVGAEEEDLKRDIEEGENVSGPRTKRARVD